MTRRSHRIASLCTLVAAVASCGEPTAPSSSALITPETTAIANGRASTVTADVEAVLVKISSPVLNGMTVDRYSFIAVRRGDVVQGYFYLYQIRIVDGAEQAVVIASGPMVCASVTSNKAKVGGRVDYTTFPEGIPKGSEITWSVTDNSPKRKTPDTGSIPLGNNARAYCELGLPYPERPLERGFIRVGS
jgi:hypothetical protein